MPPTSRSSSATSSRPARSQLATCRRGPRSWSPDRTSRVNSPGRTRRTGTGASPARHGQLGRSGDDRRRPGGRSSSAIAHNAQPWRLTELAADRYRVTYAYADKLLADPDDRDGLLAAGGMSRPCGSRPKIVACRRPLNPTLSTMSRGSTSGRCGSDGSPVCRSARRRDLEPAVQPAPVCPPTPPAGPRDRT